MLKGLQVQLIIITEPAPITLNRTALKPNSASLQSFETKLADLPVLKWALLITYS